MARLAMGSRPLFLKIALAVTLPVFCGLIAGLFGQAGGYYLPGPASTVGDIQSQTVSPFNPGRTDIGIGESVNCSIDPSTWSDTDIYVDPYGNQSNISDGMGMIVWAYSGSGTVYPLVGDSTTLTADLTDADDTVTVQATIPDSGTKGLDPALVRNVAFAMKVPTAIKVLTQASNKPGTAPPPSLVLGLSHDFKYQVLPSTVDFGPKGGKVLFRENRPGDSWTWPDGTQNRTLAGTTTWNVSTDMAGNVNTNTDTVASGPDPIARLAGQDFSYTIRVPEDYQDQGGNWQAFYTNTDETHVRSYRAATLDGRATFKTTINFLAGTYMGPWKSIP